MSKYWSLKGQNRGASLIAVITAIVFVSIIGVVITQLTITNIQMKEMEQQGKTNFYSAEEVMDDLVAGMNVCAAEQMQTAYLDILSQYRTVTSYDKSLQDIFKEMYVRNLVDYFGAGAGAESYVKKSTNDNNEVKYEVGKYKIPTIAACFSKSNFASYLKVAHVDDATPDWSESDYRADFTNGRFILEDIEVTVPDPNNPSYTTTIHTDIVFSAPNLRFDEGNVIREFMRYSLIADKSIRVNVVANVDGNVYAGPGGIYADGSGNGKFVGNTIITRGDVSVRPGTTLTFGHTDINNSANNKAVNLWAENMTTQAVSGASDPSHLYFYGTAYIADDLEMNGKNSEVKLAGNYYGYNFQKQYDGLAAVHAPEYSSTIAINATGSKLNMEDLKNLWLAGRTYLTRGETEDDVLLGESLSVRSNQMAYYVPEKFITETPSGPELVDPSGAELSNYLGVTISDYINLADPVVTYYFQNVGGPDKMYFLKFTSDNESQAANNFFADFYNNNKDRMDEFAKSYLDSSAVILNSMAVTLKGDIIYRNSDNGDLHVNKQPIEGEQWATGGAMYNRAGIWNAKYKSLQLWLEENHEGITSTTERFTDKNSETLFSHIIDENRFNEMFVTPGEMEVWNDTPDGSTSIERNAVILVKRGDADIYEVPDKVKGGIIVANCNVRCSGAEFKGLIISKGEISFVGGASVSADEVLVSQLFADDLIRSTRLFTPVFQGYGILNEENIGTVNVNKYLTFDNWSKTLK